MSNVKIAHPLFLRIVRIFFKQAACRLKQEWLRDIQIADELCYTCLHFFLYVIFFRPTICLQRTPAPKQLPTSQATAAELSTSCTNSNRKNDRASFRQQRPPQFPAFCKWTARSSLGSLWWRRWSQSTAVYNIVLDRFGMSPLVAYCCRNLCIGSIAKLSLGRIGRIKAPLLLNIRWSSS